MLVLPHKNWKWKFGLIVVRFWFSLKTEKMKVNPRTQSLLEIKDTDPFHLLLAPLLSVFFFKKKKQEQQKKRYSTSQPFVISQWARVFRITIALFCHILLISPRLMTPSLTRCLFLPGSLWNFHQSPCFSRNLTLSILSGGCKLLRE